MSDSLVVYSVGCDLARILLRLQVVLCGHIVVVGKKLPDITDGIYYTYTWLSPDGHGSGGRALTAKVRGPRCDPGWLPVSHKFSKICLKRFSTCICVYFKVLCYVCICSVGPGTGVPFHIHGPTFAETIWGRKVCSIMCVYHCKHHLQNFGTALHG